MEEIKYILFFLSFFLFILLFFLIQVKKTKTFKRRLTIGIWIAIILVLAIFILSNKESPEYTAGALLFLIFFIFTFMYYIIPNKENDQIYGFFLMFILQYFILVSIYKGNWYAAISKIIFFVWFYLLFFGSDSIEIQ